MIRKPGLRYTSIKIESALPCIERGALPRAILKLKLIFFSMPPWPRCLPYQMRRASLAGIKCIVGKINSAHGRTLPEWTHVQIVARPSCLFSRTSTRRLFCGKIYQNDLERGPARELMVTSTPLRIVFSVIAEARPSLRLENVLFLRLVFVHPQLTLLRRVACRKDSTSAQVLSKPRQHGPGQTSCGRLYKHALAPEPAVTGAWTKSDDDTAAPFAR